jgi:hypothetical protein
MDDGGYHLSGLTIHTNSYTKEEVELLQSVLLTKYKIYTNLWSKKSYWIIYVPASHLPTLRTVVLPYMCSSMKYKVHVD